MRELKFRAWHKKVEVMAQMPEEEHDGDNFSFLDDSGERLASDYSIGEAIQYDGIEVMQHTGLKDCEGTEIYEGDILIFDWVFQDSGRPYTPECKDIKGVVNWENGKFVVSFFKNLMSFDLSDINQLTFERFWSQEYRSSTDFFKMTGFKVIGNIHQHKHLLEG